MLSIPLRTSADCNLTVTTTATNLYTLIDTAGGETGSQKYYSGKFAAAISIQAEDGDIRWLERGAPTSTEGNLIKKGQKEWIPGVQLGNMSLISISGSVKVTVIPCKGEVGDSPALMAGEISIETGDIEIGAVEIKNHDSDVRAEVDTDHRLTIRDYSKLVPEAYDYMLLTYVAAGNGAGEIETVTYKTGGSGGSTVALLTLTYDANNEILTVTKT